MWAKVLVSEKEKKWNGTKETIIGRGDKWMENESMSACMELKYA